MKTAMRWSVLLLVLVTWHTHGVSGTIIGKVGTTCFPTSYNAPGFNLDVYGDWIENIDRVTAPPGVIVSIVAKHNGAQNNTGPHPGKGDVTLRISTDNATPGTKTINLINDPDLGVGGETFSFSITVVASPTVTSVDVPSPAEPFKDITVTLHGTGLDGATDPAAGSIVVDNLIPLITVGGNATVTSVRVLSSSETALQAKIFFSALVQDVTVELVLKSATACSPLGSIVSHAAGFKTRVRVKSTNVKNYVQSIDFPTGNLFDKNSIGTINVNLLFAAQASGLIRLRGGLTMRTLVSNDNAKVFFKFVPANAFTRPDGTPFQTDAAGFSTLTAATGDDIVPITFKVVDCLGARVGQPVSVKIQTWMHNVNTNQPPEFIEQTFNVRCAQ